MFRLGFSLARPSAGLGRTGTPVALRAFSSSPYNPHGYGSDPFGQKIAPRPYDGTKPFDKILIANRGEIACRVMRTAKRMGIKTVAVYSEPDANSLHVAMADEAVCVGPAASKDSYLNVPAILNAIETTGAQAVHPGYGFLSENSQFSDTLAKMGVAFIGPASYSISAMGDKIESKKIAEAARVNTIPGFNGVVEDVEHARQIANNIGYPVMVKASAGGGGKGMRIAWSDADLIDAYRLSKNEAAASFGDDRLLVEKFIANPRHIEIQVLGDKFGNTIYLNERECSIQRRNQKVIEEAPSSHIDPATRAAMGEQAVRLAQAVGYYSAGTVEMLVDDDRNFYFLEMNTRLQVEHPVTEYITGVDLVEQMINVAANRPLPLAQSDIGINGWSFESRVYAEDPVRYLPSVGRLRTYIEPEQAADVRVDSGIVEGSEISVYYDPMISKVITHGATRDEARMKMIDALDNYAIQGVRHNIPLIRDVLTAPRFVEGRITTNYLEEEYPEGFQGYSLKGIELDELLGVVGKIYAQTEAFKRSFNTETTAVLNDGPTAWDTHIRIAGVGEYRAVIHAATPERPVFMELVEENRVLGYDTDSWSPGQSIIHGAVLALDEGKATSYDPDGPMGDISLVSTPTSQFVCYTPLGFKLVHCGTEFDVQVLTHRQYLASKHMLPKAELDTSSVVLAPMPGTVVSIAVQPGDRVVEGQEVAIVEAMKMQNVLRASRDGIVKAVSIKAGSSVSADEVIIEFEPLPKKEAE